MHTKERQSRGFNPRLDHLFDRYSMKHMVNNRMFAKPLSLNAIGAAAGLSAPRSMLALRGKTIYNSAGTATVIPTTGTVSLFSFENKTFTSPVNPVIFKSIFVGTATISEAGKKFSFTGGTYVSNTDLRSVIGNGNAVPFYLNINTDVMFSAFSYYATYDNAVSGTAVFYKEGFVASSTTSIYFTNGLTKDIVLIFAYTSSASATITSSALYTGNIVNFTY